MVEDLVDCICEPIHRMNMADVKKEIVSFPSIFEKALVQSIRKSDAYNDNKNDIILLEILKEKNEVRYFEDDYIYWDTELYLINDNQFVFIHWQHDGEERDHFIVEGFLENQKIKIERIFYKSWTEESVCLSLAQMLEKHGSHMISSIPFQFVMEKMIGEYEDDNHMIDLNYHSGKSWKDVEFMTGHYFGKAF